MVLKGDGVLAPNPEGADGMEGSGAGAASPPS